MCPVYTDTLISFLGTHLFKIVNLSITFTFIKCDAVNNSHYTMLDNLTDYCESWNIDVNSKKEHNYLNVTNGLIMGNRSSL